MFSELLYISEGCHCFDSIGKSKAINSRKLVYAKQGDGAIMSLPFKKGGSCRPTRILAYSNTYIMSFRVSVNPGYGYITNHNMDFDVEEFRVTLKEQSENVNKNKKIMAYNQKVFDLIAKYFTSDELVEYMKSYFDQAMKGNEIVRMIQCDDAELPIQKLRQANLKR